MMTVANDRARVAQNDETIENLKRNRRQDKQIDRRDAVDPTAMNIFDTRPDPSYGCPSRKSYPRVAMMQSGQDWCDHNGPRSLDRRATIEQRPYTAAAVALGIGYLIGRFGRRANY